MTLVPRLDDGQVTVYLGDCRDVLPQLADDSVDVVITDPPYGLGFMGKTWDSPGGTGDFPMRRYDALNTVNTGASRQGGRQRSTEDFAKRQARDARSYASWCETWATECLRVLKPGGHLLAFGGTRTYHRLASGIEDAGFEVRDCIAWLYGSGFPKSVDVSKGIDKAKGATREVVGKYELPDVADGRRAKGWECTNTTEPGVFGVTGQRDLTAPATPEAEKWEGWGTALKPAHEPIVLARKSTKGTVVANVLEHGTGAMNIDACRVPGDEDGSRNRPPSRLGSVDTYAQDEWTRTAIVERNDTTGKGRWPPNVTLDPTTAEALDAQTGVLISGANPERRGSDKFRDTYGEFKGQEECDAARGADEGGASRFFPVFRYEAKAGENERPKVALGGSEERLGGATSTRCSLCGKKRVNVRGAFCVCPEPQWEREQSTVLAHPTVKPIALLRWLVRLVTPPGGLVLDPFLGSGTTAEACIAEGVRCVGIEREEDYMALIEARLGRPIQTGFALGGTA